MPADATCLIGDVCTRGGEQTKAPGDRYHKLCHGINLRCPNIEQHWENKVY